MPFIWNTTPNLPTPVPPFVIGSDELTYKAHAVANTVNAGGELSYNTPNVGFDVVYELESLNVRNLQVTTLNAGSLTINTATISTASINRASINIANMNTVFIQYGFMGNNPGSNLEIATKGYADGQAANVPSGGSDLELLIDAKGDLLVGIAANTLTRLPKGTDGQILTVDGSTNTGLIWKTISGSGTFHNLWIQTHYNLSLKDHQLLLRNADEVIMNDGIRVSGWSNMVVDIELSGAGGLDTGVEGPSHWYEVYAVANSAGEQISMVLHRAPEILLDQSLTTTTDTGITLRRTTGGTATKIAQGFVPAIAGPLTSVEMELSRTGSPTGLIWVTVEADSSGFPSGTPLATSRVMDVARLPTDKARIRFLFDTNTSVSIGTTYHIVCQSDYTVSDTNYATAWGIAAGGYGSGSASEFRVAWFASTTFSGPADLWFKTFVQGTLVTEVVMPAGYDQRTLISYVYNNSAGHFKRYTQKDRNIVMGIWEDWRAFTAITGLIEAVDLGTYIPPVICTVQFALWTAHGSPRQPSPIGGVASTDMPATIGTASGSIAANVRDSAQTSPGVSVDLYGKIVVESQVILARMQNVDSRLYSTAVSF